MRFLLVPLISILLTSCSTGPGTGNNFFRPDNITVQSFTVNPVADTFLRAKGGSRFFIRKGTFPQGQEVTVQIREVLTPAEILLSGIPTLADGRTLKSGGMFSFDASTAGKMVEPALPVEVDIPTAKMDRDMLLFKGELTEDSILNWVDPVAIDTVPVDQLVKAGEVVFSKCRSCHAVFKDGTGPALYNLQYRGPWRDIKKLTSFVRNPIGFMEKDVYTRDLKSKFGSVMTAFPEWNEQSIQALVAYISTRKTEVPEILGDRFSDTLQNNSPCGFDTSYVTAPDQLIYDTSRLADELVNDRIYIMPGDSVDSSGLEDPGNYIAEPYEIGQYSFTIQANGWYNIDAYIPDANAVPATGLSVKIENPDNMYLQVQLFIPETRTLQDLHFSGGSVYTIPYKNRMLPANERAVVIAVGSFRDKSYYAVREFRTSASSKLELDLQETTPAKINNVLNTYRIDGVDILSDKNERVISPVYCDTWRDSTRSLMLTDSTRK